MLYNNLTYKFKEISKSKLGMAGDNDIYEYVISTRPYNSDKDATYARAGYSLDSNIKKKKYLIVSGMDGNEHKAVLSVYKFAYDLLHGYNIPNDFKEGVEIHIIPIATPSAFDEFSYTKPNGIYIERNFNATNPEPETQIIKSWLENNKDAQL